MRGAIWVLIVFCSLFLGLSDNEAFWGKKRTEDKVQPDKSQAIPFEVKPAQTTTEAQKKSDKEIQQARDAQRLLVESKRKKLNGTGWDIELVFLESIKTGKPKKENHILIFNDNQVSLHSFIKRGFQPTNYTLSVQENGAILWETMQKSDTNGIIFLRGEIEQDLQKMQGNMNHQISDKLSQDYYFTSISKKDIAQLQLEKQPEKELEKQPEKEPEKKPKKEPKKK